MTALGQFDEALVLFDGVIALRPDDARAYFNRGYLLARVGKFDEARKNYRAAIEHMPGYFEAYYNIAHGLCYEQGKFDEAATELEKNLKLVSSLPAEKTRWLRLIAECRRLRSLDQQLSDLLRSGARPRSAAEACDLAYIATWPHRKLYGLATQFYEQAFALEPARANDLVQGYRYHAAGCAARAGSGLGRDQQAPGDAARWRNQALEWLRAELTARRQQIAGGRAEQARESREKLHSWQTDPHLARVRKRNFLDKLPEPEQASWREFWTQVAQTLI